MIDRRKLTPFSLLAVLGIFFLCMLLSYIVSFAIFGTPGSEGYDYGSLIGAQIVSSVITFALPAIIVSSWKSNSSLDTLTDIKRVPLVGWILAIACLTVCQPLVQWSCFVNEQLCMRMDSWENLRAFSKMTNTLIFNMMKHDTISECVVLFFVIAVLPAVVEEMFFRGTLQRIMTLTTNNAWVAIFTASTVFSLMHGDIVAFLPRFILGFLLGTIYHFGKNIWVNIAAHAFNNSMAVITVIFSDDFNVDTMNQLQENPGPIMPIIALALTIFGIQGFIYRTKNNQETV